VRRFKVVHVLLGVAWLAAAITKVATAQAPADLKVELRSGSESNQFQIGEDIRLDVLFSSTSPGRYLEPCALFRTSHFGFPQCRFFNGWTFEITPTDGWVDLEKEFPTIGRGGGPTFEVPSHDLTTDPFKTSFLLTSRYRFDVPGKYMVRFTTKVALDDASTAGLAGMDRQRKANSIDVVRELAIEIVPASAQWQKETIERGYAAFTTTAPQSTNPPTEEFKRYTEAKRALCKLGTDDAARTLVRLLIAGHNEVEDCLESIPKPDAAIVELKRLMNEPDIPVSLTYFNVLTRLLSRDEARKAQLPVVSRNVADTARQDLFAAIQKKQGEPQMVSLATLLHHPPQSTPAPMVFSYALPSEDPVIALAAASWDRLPEESRQWLLGPGWAGIHSPRMLPIVRRAAETGNEDGLLRWYELDLDGARKFARAEVVQPAPRFSAFSIRLPEQSLSGPEQEQVAKQFANPIDSHALGRQAMLLNRYTTRSVLPIVLPVIDAHLQEWDCSVRAPALAYLVRVAPEEAGLRVERALQYGRNYCQIGGLLTALGTFGPSPVLERIAVAQMNADTAFAQGSVARDGLEYVRRWGSPAMKPVVWGWLVRWQPEPAAEDGIDLSTPQGFAAQMKRERISGLVNAYTAAHGWIVTPEDKAKLEALRGERRLAQLSCSFNCAAPYTVGPSPGNYVIYGHVPEVFYPNPRDAEYVQTTERLSYQINQYGCRTLADLKEKILQLPKGSTFGFAYGFDERYKPEMLDILAFLKAHGYVYRSGGFWPFLNNNDEVASMRGRQRRPLCHANRA
jgi:hypothetical protein